MKLANHHFLAHPYGYTYYRLNQMRLLKSAVGRALLGLVALQLGSAAFLLIDIAWLIFPDWFRLNYESLSIPAWVICIALIAAVIIERVVGGSESQVKQRILFASEDLGARRRGTYMVIGFYALSFICFVMLAVLPFIF